MKPECIYRGALAECHALDCPVHGHPVTYCHSCYDCLNKPELGMRNPVLSRFIVCPYCGNKRCPKGTNHANACTGSNEEDQPGSRYGGLPLEDS